jgi:hypothetical protein
MNVDWSRQVYDPTTGVGSIGWCFLYSDCEHEVLPVESGLRVTLAYDVFYHSEAPATYPSGEEKFVLGDSRANEMLALLSQAFDPQTSSDFFPNGATLGFGLRHAYAGREGWVQMDYLDSRLKGIDRALLSVIIQCGLDWDIKAVYQFNNREVHSDATYIKEGKRAKGEWRPKNEYELSPQSWKFYAQVLLSDDPCLLDGNNYVEDKYRELIDAGAERRPDIVWITKPTLYESRNDYVAYGNGQS